MFEFTVGTRFYYKGKLCEVYANDDLDHCCDYCVLPYDACKAMICRAKLRKDNTEVCFKWIEE